MKEKEIIKVLKKVLVKRENENLGRYKFYETGGVPDIIIESNDNILYCEVKNKRISKGTIYGSSSTKNIIESSKKFQEDNKPIEYCIFSSGTIDEDTKAFAEESGIHYCSINTFNERRITSDVETCLNNIFNKKEEKTKIASK